MKLTEFYLRDKKIKTVIDIFQWADKHTDDKYIVSLRRQTDYLTTMEKGICTFGNAIRYIDDSSVKHFRIRLKGNRLVIDIAEVYVEGVEHIMGIYLNEELFDEFERKYELYR
jgi:hypothetical protein